MNANANGRIPLSSILYIRLLLKCRLQAPGHILASFLSTFLIEALRLLQEDPLYTIQDMLYQMIIMQNDAPIGSIRCSNLLLTLLCRRCPCTWLPASASSSLSPRFCGCLSIGGHGASVVNSEAFRTCNRVWRLREMIRILPSMDRLSPPDFLIAGPLELKSGSLCTS